jgi:transposase InsO family protein
MIGLSPSTYYYDPKRSRASREREDASLRDAIESVQAEHPTAGYRRVQVYLRRRGRWVGERRIRRIMKRFSLQADIRRAFVHTTDSNHSHRVYPNLLPGRVLTGVNQAWGADLTYIRVNNGFVYLAVILDLFSRRVIGWAISKHIDAELALTALKQAITTRNPPPGCVHHSDRGVQGGFKWSLQHLKIGGVVWDDHEDG